MYTINVDYLLVDEMFVDLDAIELLMLSHILHNARETVWHCVLRGTVDPIPGDAMVNDLTTVLFDALLSCSVRCKSISSAKELLAGMPTRREWQPDSKQ